MLSLKRLLGTLVLLYTLAVVIPGTLSSATTESNADGNISAEFALSDITLSKIVDSGEKEYLPSVTYPYALNTAVVIQDTEKLSVRFSVAVKSDSESAVSMKPSQVAIMTSAITANGRSSNYVYLPTKIKKDVYEFQLNYDKSFPPQLPGNHELSVVVGSFDSGSTKVKPIYYKMLSQLTLSFTPPEEHTPDYTEDVMEPLPEIKHQFRPEPSYTSPFFSPLFSIAVLMPWSILYIGYQNFKTQFSIRLDTRTMGFIGCLAGFAVLYFLYWTILNIFQLFTLWVPLATMTILTGHQTLKKLAMEKALAINTYVEKK